MGDICAVPPFIMVFIKTLILFRSLFVIFNSSIQSWAALILLHYSQRKTDPDGSFLPTVVCRRGGGREAVCARSLLHSECV